MRRCKAKRELWLRSEGSPSAKLRKRDSGNLAVTGAHEASASLDRRSREVKIHRFHENLRLSSLQAHWLCMACANDAAAASIAALHRAARLSTLHF